MYLRSLIRHIPILIAYNTGAFLSGNLTLIELLAVNLVLIGIVMFLTFFSGQLDGEE